MGGPERASRAKVHTLVDIRALGHADPTSARLPRSSADLVVAPPELRRGGLGLYRPARGRSLTPQAIDARGRNNREVGTIGVVPTSEQRRLRVRRPTCRAGHRLSLCAAAAGTAGVRGSTWPSTSVCSLTL